MSAGRICIREVDVADAYGRARHEGPTGKGFKGFDPFAS